MVYGMTLRLPGEFTENYTVDAHIQTDYSDKLWVAISRLWLCLALQLHHHWLLLTMDPTRSYQGVAECSKFCRKARLKWSLQTVSNQRISSVSLSQVPHKSVKCNPSCKKANKPAAIARKPCAARARSCSTITPQPLKTGGKSDRTTDTQSLTFGVGSGPAIAPQSDMTRARLPNPPIHFIKHRIPERTLLLALTGGTGVVERTGEYIAFKKRR